VSPAARPEACRFYQAQIEGKLKAGYVETTKDDVPLLEATGRALEQAVVEHPDELAAHMAFADYLSEQSDPRLQTRGEFIRIQLALEDESLPAEQRRRLARREKQLLAAHEREWLGWRLSDLLFDGGDDWPGAGSAKMLAAHRGYRRGWLDRLVVPNLGKMAVAALWDSPAVRLLRHLVIEKTEDIIEPYWKLAGCQVLTNVRYLDVRDVGEEDSVGKLVGELPRIEEIHLCSRSGILARLVELDLSHGCITDAGARLLAASPDYKHLKKLVIEDNRLDEGGVRALRRKGLKLEADDQQEYDFELERYDDGYLYIDNGFDDNDWE
jgi:uncharacterized protein (TIGR02996 family)